jgi:hypothetical protein
VRSRKGYREGLAAMLPVIGGREDVVREMLRLIPAGEDSPFARLESTHFARLVFVSALRDRRGREVDELPAFLFFSAEFDIPVAGYLEALCTLIPVPVDAIFEHCVSYPGAADPPAFKAWMSDHRVQAGFSLHGNPRPRVQEVVESLRLRERLIGFAVETRALDPVELKRRWDEQEWEAPA